MASLPEDMLLQHFAHPEHLLTIYNSNTEYECDGCYMPGIGKRYCCHGCNFDLHEYCGLCPPFLSSFMHSHQLKLTILEPQADSELVGFCDVCCDPVEGIFYRCNRCNFDVHPLCTQLPRTLRHALHQQQYLSGHANGFSSYRSPPNPSFPSSSNMHNNYMAQHQSHGQAQLQQGGGGRRIGKVMFKLVKTIGIGVISHMMFGVDVSPLFAA
uniref:DC1 domain-containing protein n=1 Tax=Nicotiana tabacum TaxID=4097 RepID=A0A1S3XLL3_TOBAC|nr:PREDICTED: uncharacterized protein LOC107766525 [Nicotiana tabacum]